MAFSSGFSDIKLSELFNKVSEEQLVAYYLGINEKHNVRGKYTANDIKNMSNGQLNSFYNNSYKESSKARRRIENTSNPKTRAKYQKIYDTQDDYFNKATAEKNIRGLDGKGW